MGRRRRLEPDLTDWPSLLARVAKIERQWAGEGDERERCVPFIPLAPARFVTYLVDALGAAPGDRFLDAGCGPGGKVLLAADGFGLAASGFDRVPAMVEAATAAGAKVVLGDVLEWDYSGYDIILVNRPCAGALQAELEQRVMTQMPPGSVLILVNSSGRPPPGEWESVVEEVDLLCGVWRKLVSSE